MQTADPAYGQHALARLTDYFMSEGIPWSRRLWDVGSILALEELCEAGVWQPRKVIAPSAMDWQRHELKRLVGPDLGMGDGDLRRELIQLLSRSDLAEPGPGHRRLRQITEHARVGYLDRWVAALQAGKAVKPERLARTLASHLLDLGYTPTYLATNWVRVLRSERADAVAIAESAAAIARESPKYFEVLLALDTIPKRADAESSPGWMHKAEVNDWLRSNGHADEAGVRSGGAFVYSVEARDPYSAAEKVRRIYERLVARSLFIRKDRGGLKALPYLWVADHSEVLPLEGKARSADVLALSHMGHLYTVSGEPSTIDDALELAAPVNQAAPGPAVAGAWAAVESLLTNPGDPVSDDERSGKAVAADRLAAIVACSWPRAELTTLIHRHKPTLPDALVRAREGLPTNRERARAILEEIKANGVGNLRFVGATRYSDMAAAERMRDCIAEPKRVIGEVTKAIQIALRRLYRARNLVLHGGSTSSVVLDAALRTAAPLVGAGLDRIAHHFYESQMSPLDLAARAELSASLVDGDSGLSLVDLLQRPGV
ncbi:hypothetical protein AB0A74_20200 [Saccharothrix sp. NPDC042600]|uniref:integrase n=1 Tax=Saccharothrix TaxID=2071 RepID=UPI0033CE3FBA|nr:hypothetical protein GCM10017745_75270 [Saccharothrix mutabilis subsp. capreolus]